ncbi:MAG: cytochrome c3 family protein [Desulfuromonadales bacterium]|nr:cytochrome c3 family protein [Desulfuromonadales bacterium]
MKLKQTIRIFCLLLPLLGGVAAAKGVAADIPDQIILGNMADLYTGVAFDHTLHTELGEDCAVCHHHTTGTGTSGERCTSCHADSQPSASVACADCHMVAPFSAEQINRDALDRYQYHVDKPGLKAAYHWSCVGCHEVMDGPTGCQDCHARSAAGDAFYHADAQPSPRRAGAH